MRYTMQDKKTEFEGQQLVTGINCQPESVYADFMTTKRLYHKTDGVLFYHMVQSFPKGEAVDPVTAHAAALKLAEYYEGYEVLVCTHTDREHIHSHFLINSVNFDTGRKLHIAKEQLQELRQRNDMVCKEFSLPVFQPREQKQKTKYSFTDIRGCISAYVAYERRYARNNYKYRNHRHTGCNGFEPVVFKCRSGSKLYYRA